MITENEKQKKLNLELKSSANYLHYSSFKTTVNFANSKLIQKTSQSTSVSKWPASNQNQIESNLSLYLLYYAEACNNFAGPISASLRPGNTASCEEMTQRWQTVDNTVSDLTGSRFEPQTSRSRDEQVTAWPTGR